MAASMPLSFLSRGLLKAVGYHPNSSHSILHTKCALVTYAVGIQGSCRLSHVMYVAYGAGNPAHENRLSLAFVYFPINQQNIHNAWPGLYRLFPRQSIAVIRGRLPQACIRLARSSKAAVLPSLRILLSTHLLRLLRQSKLYCGSGFYNS